MAFTNEDPEERRYRLDKRFNRRVFLMGVGVVLGAATLPAWLRPFQQQCLREAEPLWVPSLDLKRFGASLTVSDTALRRQRLPAFERGLYKIGRQMARDLRDIALEELLDGPRYR